MNLFICKFELLDFPQKVNTVSKTTVLDTNAYGVFGEIDTLAGTDFGFTVQRYDSDLDLYYFKARFYSGRIGRFLQTDPAGYIPGEGFNLYAYAMNSPLRYTDPYGLNVYDQAEGTFSEVAERLRNTQQELRYEPDATYILQDYNVGLLFSGIASVLIGGWLMWTAFSMFITAFAMWTNPVTFNAGIGLAALATMVMTFAVWYLDRGIGDLLNIRLSDGVTGNSALSPFLGVLVLDAKNNIARAEAMLSQPIPRVALPDQKEGYIV